VDRRFGLATDPEPREAITLDLPLPISGNRADFSETLIDDLSKHPFANLPVTITLRARDAAGQTGEAAPLQVVLPGRRFFDPLAAAMIEVRRDLLWSAGNAPGGAGAQGRDPSPRGPVPQRKSLSAPARGVAAA
jgi:hypothetical protein